MSREYAKQFPLGQPVLAGVQVQLGQLEDLGSAAAAAEFPRG